MMAGHFHVTYEVITEESATDGEAAERGWAIPGGWRFSTDHQDANDPALLLTLREARNMVGSVEDNGHWFSETDGTPNYQTGDQEYLSVYPPSNITAASYRRVARCFGIKDQRTA